MNKKQRAFRIWGIYLSPAMIAMLLVICGFFVTKYTEGEGRMLGQVYDLTDPNQVDALSYQHPKMADAVREEITQDGSGTKFLWISPEE